MILITLEKKSKEEDYLPIPFGEYNIRGAVYLQTEMGWEKTNMILPTINPTNDTLKNNLFVEEERHPP